MTANPNAAVGAGSGLTGGAIVVYLLGLAGVTVDPYGAVVIATAASSLVLLVGREGARGLLGRVWRGTPRA